MGCSALNSHLYHFLKVTDSEKCNCGASKETPTHCFFLCLLYETQRTALRKNLRNFEPLNTNLLMYGNLNLTFKENNFIFKVILKFIRTTKRFKN